MAGASGPATTDDRRCWRCILLNRKCDRMPICQICLNLGNEGLKILSCNRGLVVEEAKNFDSAFCNIVELSDREWLFCTGEKHWKITIDYTQLGLDKALSHAILDFPTFLLNTSTVNSDEAPYKAFLNQFNHVRSRWHLYHEDVTLELVQRAAEHQSTLFEHLNTDGTISSPAPEWLKESPLFSALRCLVLSCNIAWFAYNVPLNFHVDDDLECDEYEVNKAEYNPNNTRSSNILTPYVALQCMKDLSTPYQGSRKEPSEILAHLLQASIENARDLLLKGKPEHWPTIFLTMCLLLIVKYDLETTSHCIDTFLPALHTLHNAIESLSQLFLHCCGDLHPLCEYKLDDEEWFHLTIGRSVGPETWNLYTDFNKIWLEQRNEDEHAQTSKDFIQSLYNFVMGWLG